MNDLLTFDEAKERKEGTTGTEYQFGTIEVDLALLPVKERMLCLPEGVLQFNNLMDTNGCASRTPLNILEAKLNYFYDNGMHPAIQKWCNDNGYRKNGKFVLCDAFIEILSGTTRSGNSLKAPIDAIYRYGVIPAHLLPLKDGMTWEEYMDKKRVTQKHLDLGKEFLRRIGINYEQVHTSNFLEALKVDLLAVGGHAWEEPVNGVYERTDAPFNHAFAGVTDQIKAFDTYEPFVKELKQDFKFFDWGYQLSITRQTPEPEVVEGILVRLWKMARYDLWAALLKAFFNPPQTPAPAPAPAPVPVPTKPIGARREAIYQAALKKVGVDASPKDRVDDEVACVESLATIVREVMPFPDIFHTKELLDFLNKSKQWKATLEPTRGNLVVSATGTGNGSVRGHCGVHAGNNEIMSNTSKDGIWRKNYTIESWVRRYRQNGGMRVYYFEPIDN